MFAAGPGMRQARAAAGMQTRNLVTADGVALVTRRIAARGDALGVAYVGHGQAQHSMNLAPFLHGLAGCGWTVQATDLRGHGHSASSRAPLAHMDVNRGWDRLLSDMRCALEAAFDGVAWERRLVVAPNIGAALVVELLRTWPDLAARIVLAAPPTLNTAILGLARAFMAARVRLRPPEAPDDLALHQMYTFLSAQLPERRGLIDVVSSDRAITDALVADPLSWPTPTSGYFHEMFRGLALAWSPERETRARPGTRILILHGDEDPVTGSGQFLEPLRRVLARAGLHDTERMVIAGGRSGLLLEEARFGLSQRISDWAAAPGPAPQRAGRAPSSGPVTSGVLDRLGVVDPAEPLAEDALVELCYHAIDDESRWIELLYRLVHALPDGDAQPPERLDALIAALMPHWERSFSLNRRIAQAAAVGTVLQNVIERFRIGVAIVTTDLRVLFANAAFTAQAAPDLGDDPDTGLLSARVRALCGPQVQDMRRRGAQETLLMQDDRPCGFYFRPAALRQTTLQRGGASGVVILQSEPAKGADRESALLDLLQFAYGLTQKEAETALGLLDGLSADAIATRLGVSVNTVRTHLKRVYDKTGVQTQTELVARLLRGPIGLLAGRGQA